MKPEPRNRYERANREFNFAALRMFLLSRLDIVLMILLGSVTVAVSTVLLIVVLGGLITGAFEPPTIQPLDDPRILVNVEQNIGNNPVLDAVVHHADNRLAIAQSGGVLHWYHPPTELWHTEQPFDAADPMHSDWSWLRSGCGVTDPELAADCPDTNSLWALGADGSLAWRDNGRWSIAVNNTRLQDTAGNPVLQENLTTAALSDDKTWLLVGTSNTGAGLYHVPRREWQPLTADNPLATATVTQLEWWRGRFWIGTPEGLYAATIDNDQLTVNQVSAQPERVLDLDADANGLWLLSERACEETGAACLWTGRMADPSGTFETLLNERNNYADALSFGQLQFAQQLDSQNQLVLAGQAGIYRYDLISRSWQQLFEEPVSAILSLPDDTGFYFAYPSGAGQITAGTLSSTWEIADRQVEQLLFDPSGDVLALSNEGNIFRLLPGSPEGVEVFRQSDTAFDPQTMTGALVGNDAVVFVSPDGITLHQISTQQYDDLPPSALPDWMLTVYEQQVIGNTVFAFSETGNGTAVYPLPAERISDRDYYLGGDIGRVNALTFPGRSERVWQWGNDAIGVLSSDGNIYRLNATGINPRTQSRAPGVTDASLRDALLRPDGIWFAVDDTIRAYDYSSRSWSEVATPVRLRDEIVLSLTESAGDVIARTSLGRVVQTDGSTVINGESAFQFDDAAFSDVLAHDAFLDLAGNSTVQRYDLNRREIVSTWDIAEAGAPRIKGLVNNLPVWLVNNRVALGDDVLNRNEDPVIHVSLDDSTIWTVRRADSHRYLMGYAHNNPRQTTCYFRTPVAPGASQILDARALSDGRVLVATDAGLMLYQPRYRTWHPTRLNDIDRIYNAGADFLLLVDESGADVSLSLVEKRRIPAPSGCDTDPVSIPVADDIEASAYTVDEGGQVAWLLDNGEVYVWSNDVQIRRFGANDSAPQPGTFRRTFDRSASGFLLFTTRVAIWHYDLSQRTWSRIELNIPPDSDINIEAAPDGAGSFVTAKAPDDTLYAGSFRGTPDEVTLQAVYNPAGVESLPLSGDELLDVQARTAGADRWTFLLTDRVAYYDPVQRTWSESVSLPSDTTRQFQQAGQRGVLTTDTAWWLAIETGAHPQSFARYDVVSGDREVMLTDSGDIYRLNANGGLYLCQPGDTTYQCNQRITPLTLTSGTVRYAVSRESYLFFVDASGLQLYDTDTNSAVSLPTEASALTDLSAIYDTGNAWLLYADTLDRVLLLEKSLNQAQLIDGVSNLVRSYQDDWWLQTGTGWQRLRGTSLEALSAPAGAPEPVRYLMLEGGQIHVIDGSGQVYALNNQRWSQLPALPDEIVPQSIRWLAPQTTLPDSYWLLSNRVLFRLTTAACPAAPESRCFTVTDRLNVPVENPVRVIPASAEQPLTLVAAEGTLVEISQDTPDTYSLTTATNLALVPGHQIDNQWDALQTDVQTQPGGATVYNPVLSLAADAEGVLQATLADNSRISLDEPARSLPDSLTLPPALDTNWLRWNRNSAQFDVRGNGQRLLYTPQQFIQEGRLLFEPINALLYPAPDEIYAANSYGVWRFSETVLNLNDESVTYYPADLGIPLTAAHGRFITGNEQIRITAAGLQRGAIEPLRYTVGDAQFTEDIIQTTVDGQVTLTGVGLTSAFATDGFIWDANRRALAYQESALLLQSDAGVQPASDVPRDFDAGPQQIALTNAVLQSDGGGTAYLRDDTTWYQQTNDTWQAGVASPDASRPLFQNALWTWQLQNNTPVIQLNAPSHAFALRPDAPGFTSDVLRSAAAYNNTLFIATDAFFETATPANQAQNYQAQRRPALATDRMETYRSADGTRTLYNYVNGNVFQYTPGGEFQPAASDPEQERRLADVARLQFTLTGGQIEKLLQVDVPDATSRWIPYQFADGRFPFDVVTTLTTFDNQLYTGTRAGLAVYPDASRTAWSDIQALYHYGESRLAAVNRAGVPPDAPQLFIARGDTACLQRQPGTSLAPCADPSRIDRIFRAADSFWQWVRSPDDTLSGRYYQRDGSLAAQPLTIRDERVPHDRLDDALSCNGLAYTAWDTTWFSDYTQGTFDITAQVQNIRLPDAFQRFICIENPVPLVNTTISAGLYYEGNAGLYQFTGGIWQPVTDAALQSGLIDFADNPLLFSRDRLRLRERTAGNTAPFTFEQRTLSNTWRNLNWQQDPLTENYYVPLTHFEALAASDGTLWAATDAGLYTLSSGSDGNLQVDPDTLLVIPKPPTAADCRVSDMQPANGETLLRCNADSNQIFSGTLTRSNDTDVFSPGQDDPFATRMLVDTDYWQWRLVARRNGNPGNLEADWRGEPLSISDGRFSFDTLNSLALFEDNVLEIGTSAGGWFNAPRTTLAVPELTRPAVIDSAVRVQNVRMLYDITRNDGTINETPLLCLQLADDEFTLLSAGKRPAGSSVTCPQHLAHDTIWQYATDNQQLQVTVIGGSTRREVFNGRWNDDIASSLPVARIDENGTLWYWLPTRAGIQQLTDRFDPVQLYGKPDSASFAPTALWANNENVLFAQEDGLYPVQQPDSLQSDWQFSLPGDALPGRLIESLENTLQATWQEPDNEARRLALIPEGEGSLLLDTLLIDPTDFTRDADTLIEARLEETRVVFTGNFGQVAVELPPSARGTRRQALVHDGRLYLFNQTGIYQIDLAQMLQQASG